MTSLAESLVSSSSRPLTVRMRPDLVSNRQRYQGQNYFVVKEPIGLQYFRFHEEEYYILNQLDGHISLQQIKDGFEQRFPEFAAALGFQAGVLVAGVELLDNICYVGG